LLQLIFPINFRFEPRLIPQLIKGSREQPISLRFRRWSYFFSKNNLVDYLPGSFKTQSSVDYIHRAINFLYYQVHPLESLSSLLGATPDLGTLDAAFLWLKLEGIRSICYRWGGLLGPYMRVN